jgi:hypothetical protein
MKSINEFLDFEKKILDKSMTGDITYYTDVIIDSKVKYDYLVETYGKAKVDSALEENKIDKESLFYVESFNTIEEILKK